MNTAHLAETKLTSSLSGSNLKGDGEIADVSAIVIGNQLVVVNTGPEKITLTNVTTDFANLLFEPTGLEAGGVKLLPGERYQIMVTTDLSQPKHVDCDIEYINDTGTRTRTVRLKVK